MVCGNIAAQLGCVRLINWKLTGQKALQATTMIEKAKLVFLGALASAVLSTVAARERRVLDHRNLQGWEFNPEYPLLNFTLVGNDRGDKPVCEAGCEGDFSAIYQAMDKLWDEQEQDYELFFTVQGSYAVAAGIIFDNFPARVQELRDNHPGVDTLILVECPGSANDEASLAGGKLVHSFGYSTCVPSDGHTASGGTDFFVAGKTRYATSGAQIGIHSWAVCTDETCSGELLSGSDFPKDDESHQPYLKFYDDVCIPQDFYWETLSHGLPMYYIQEEEFQGTFSYMRDCSGQCELEKENDSSAVDATEPPLQGEADTASGAEGPSQDDNTELPLEEETNNTSGAGLSAEAYWWAFLGGMLLGVFVH